MQRKFSKQDFIFVIVVLTIVFTLFYLRSYFAKGYLPLPGEGSLHIQKSSY
jgi:hypothetical protein